MGLTYQNDCITTHRVGKKKKKKREKRKEERRKEKKEAINLKNCVTKKEVRVGKVNIKSHSNMGTSPLVKC